MNWSQWTWLAWIWLGSIVGWIGGALCAASKRPDYVEDEITIAGKDAIIYHQGRVWRCWIPELQCGVTADSYEQVVEDAERYLSQPGCAMPVDFADTLRLMGSEGDDLPRPDYRHDVATDLGCDPPQRGVGICRCGQALYPETARGTGGFGSTGE